MGKSNILNIESMDNYLAKYPNLFLLGESLINCTNAIYYNYDFKQETYIAEKEYFINMFIKHIYKTASKLSIIVFSDILPDTKFNYKKNHLDTSMSKQINHWKMKFGDDYIIQISKVDIADKSELRDYLRKIVNGELKRAVLLEFSRCEISQLDEKINSKFINKCKKVEEYDINISALNRIFYKENFANWYIFKGGFDYGQFVMLSNI